MEYSGNRTIIHSGWIFLWLSMMVILVGFTGYTLSALLTSGAVSDSFEEIPRTKSIEQRVIQTQSKEEKKSDKTTVCAVSDKYPKRILQWCEPITRAAQKNHIDADLIAAIILVESGGNPTAVSVSGAIGLMQIMPSDGAAAAFQCSAGPCFANRPPSDRLLDPQYNIQYGGRMIAGLIKKYGSLREALKAYGPMNVGYTYADKVLAIYRNYQSDQR